MEVEKSTELFWHLKDKIADEKASMVLKKIKQANVNANVALAIAPYKSLLKTFLFSLILGVFGLDRLYLNDKLGIFKCCLSIFSIICIGIGFLMPIMFIIGSVMFLASSIWAFVDIFVCQKLAQQKNCEIIMQVLEQYPEEN